MPRGKVLIAAGPLNIARRLSRQRVEDLEGANHRAAVNVQRQKEEDEAREEENRREREVRAKRLEEERRQREEEKRKQEEELRRIEEKCKEEEERQQREAECLLIGCGFESDVCIFTFGKESNFFKKRKIIIEVCNFFFLVR